MESVLIRIYLILAIIILAFVLLRKFIKTPPDVISLLLKKSGLFFLIFTVVLLAVSGRLNWVVPLIGVLFAFSLRMLPWVARFMPQLHRLWFAFRQNKYQSSSRASGKKSGTITIAEAYEILGLDLTASKQQIIMSHRRLIQKLHPDRGGSDYLAAQINQAKEVLLKNK